MKFLFLLLSLVSITALIGGCGNTGNPSSTVSNYSQHNLLLSVSPEGSGSVKIADSFTGEFSYENLKAIAETKNNYSLFIDTGKTVMLAAKAADGYVFDSWSGDLKSDNALIKIDMKADVSITANFRPAGQAVNTTVNGNGNTALPAMTTTTEVTSGPETTVKDFSVLTKLTVDRKELSIGEKLHIQAELQWTANDPPQSGIPLVIIWDETGTCVAAWTLCKDGKVVESYNVANCYALEKDKKYVMDIWWDMKYQSNRADVLPGTCMVQTTVAVDKGGERPELAVSSDPQFSVKINGGNTTTPAKTSTVEKPSYKVLSATTLNNTNLYAGDNLTIQANVHYEGQRTGVKGMIMVGVLSSPDLKLISTWFLGKDGLIIDHFDVAQCYDINVKQEFSMSVMWDLTNPLDGPPLPPGGYLLFTAIAEADNSGNYYYSPSDETPISFSISAKK